jgi:hypothetical protein
MCLYHLARLPQVNFFFSKITFTGLFRALEARMEIATKATLNRYRQSKEFEEQRELVVLPPSLMG